MITKVSWSQWDGRSPSIPFESRNDPPPRSNNSKNESSKQFRVIRKSGRCFKAIPWLVRAYHRVARHPKPRHGSWSPPIELPRGLEGSLSLFLSLPGFHLSLPSRRRPSYRLHPTPSPPISPPPPLSAFSSFFAPTFFTSTRPAPLPVSRSLLEFHNSNSEEGSIMDPAGFPLYSIRIIWHPVDVRREEPRTPLLLLGKGKRASEGKSETWNSIDRNHCYCRGAIWRDEIAENETISKPRRKKNYIDAGIP